MDIIRLMLNIPKKVDCFVASETWFQDHHSDSTVSIADFCCFRDDRSDRIGGGVAVWCRSHFLPEEISVNVKPAGVEVVAVKLFCKMLIIGAYIPPQIVISNHEAVLQFFIDFIDSFLNANPLFEVMLCGDFNRLKMHVICNACNLVNLHNDPTYGSAELDYILISENAVSSYSVSTATPIDESKTPHLALKATPCTGKNKSMVLTRAVYDLRSSYVQEFSDHLQVNDWSFLANCSLSFDERCRQFQLCLNRHFSETIPMHFVTFTEKNKPWITPLVKHLINERWRAYRERNFPLYNHLKQKVRKEIEKSKLIWSKKMKSRDMWKIVNETLARKTGDPMKSLYCRFDSIAAAATAINCKLVDVFSEKLAMPSLILPASNSMEKHVITSHQVYTLLKKLPNHKASSDIPNKLYKSAAAHLAAPLAMIFEESINESIVPSVWKTSAVIPVPKTPKPTSTDDIRPISLIPAPAKMLEKIVLNITKSHFLQAYGCDQFGFRPGSSTTCALIKLHDHITKCLETQDVIGVYVISYDFAKAFDRLRHDVIISRLQDCHLPKSLVCWISDYLDKRKQYIKIGTVCSHSLEVTSGVPQGSVLGPFLFSVVMGSLKVQDDNCCLVKYADDITVSVPIYKSTDNAHLMKIHNTIRSWASTFGLPLNKKKCKCLPIPRSKTFSCVSLSDVEFVEKITILGVTLNEKCTWTHHFDSIVKKASRRLFPLRLLKPHLNSAQLKTVYFALTRSVLEYAAPLFVGLSVKDATRLQAVQNRFHRLLCGKECSGECLPSLDKRRIQQATILYSRLLNDQHILHDLACKISSHNRFLLPNVLTTRRLNCFTIKAAMYCNKLKIS